MGKSCVLNPRNRGGKVSPLYTKLKDFFGNRNEAIYWYSRAISKEFPSKFPNVKMDDYGEPLFEELLDKCGLKKAQSESKTLTLLNKNHKEEAPTNYSGIRNLQEKADYFNRNNPLNKDYYASVFPKNNDPTKSELIIKPKEVGSIKEIQKISVNVGINQRLEALLNNWGIEIGVLSELEENLGINGVTDLDVALNSAKGIKQIIRIAKGERGQKALPEEFAHFAIEAMGNIPLKERLVKTLSNTEVLKRVLGDSYEDYINRYNGNLELLALEALGKLTALALNDEKVYIEHKNIFERFFEALKNFFRSKDESQIDSIINSVMTDVYKLANGIVTNKYDLKVSNIKHRESFAQLEGKVKRDSNILQKIIDQELKRLKIYGKKETFNKEQIIRIEALQRELEENHIIEGTYSYMENSLKVLQKLTDKLLIIESLSQKEKFDLLRNIKNYVSSYSSIMIDIRDEISRTRREGDLRYKEKLKNLLEDNLSLIADLTDDYYSIAKDEFSKFIEPFVGEIMSNELNNKMGKQYTAKELLESIDKDITLMDRWIDSMADSKDPILKIYDKIVKKQKGLSRLDTIAIEKEVLKKTRELELSGVKDTSFMMERDEEGNLTGEYIQKIWWSKYKKAKYKFFKELAEKYGETPTISQKEQMSKEISNWYRENTVRSKDGGMIPSDKYINPSFLRLNKAQLDYHSYIIDLKHKMDSYLTITTPNLAPQIRRDFIDRMRQSPQKGKYIWETMKDSLVRREDDIDMVEKSTIIDFEGNEVMSLPIYYTKPLQDMNDLSLDVASSIIAYAAMANDIHRMNEVINTLEVGRSILKERRVVQREGDKVKREVFSRLGTTVSNILTKKGEATRFYEKLNSYMEMQVYGRMQKDEGVVKEKVQIHKLANLLNKLTDLSTTALSPLTGIANVTQNLTVSNIESASKRFFSRIDLAKASAEYDKEVLNFLAQIGNRIKTNKLDLFDELFNIRQDHKHHVTGVDFNKKGIKKFLKEDSIYITTTIGDHYAQNRTAIALAMRYPMKLDGKDTNLWECLEIQYLDPNKPELGAKLVIKPRATKADGSAFTQDDIIDFSNKNRGIQNTLYGIYNEEDKNALQQYAIGRLLLKYRNWMRPLFMTRFGESTYNYDLGMYTEGHFRTTGKFLLQLAKDLRKHEMHIALNYNNLSDTEKGNIKKSLKEVAVFIVLSLLSSMLGFYDDDDDDKKKKEDSFTLKLAEYTVARLKTDMGALLPSTTMLDEGLKLFTSPFAALTTIKRLRNTLNLVNPVSILRDDVYTKEVTSGMYDGYKEYQKILLELLPFRRQIVNVFDPSEPAKWYK